MSSLWCIVVLLIQFQSVHCYKIVLLPFPDGYSHVHVLEKIGTELKNRGHEVVFLLSNMQMKLKFNKLQHVKKNIQVYNSSYPENYLTNLIIPDSVKYGYLSLETGWEAFEIFEKACDGLLSNNEILDSIQDADLLLNDNCFSCGSLLSKKLSIHQVDVALWGFMDLYLSRQYHIPAPYSYVPIIPWCTPKMSFLQRMVNYMASVMLHYVWSYVYNGPRFERLNQKHRIAPDRSFNDFAGDVDMLLVPVDWAVEWSRPYLPGVKVVGLVGPEPALPLSTELEAFVQGAEHGIVIVSFGSMVTHFEEKYMKLMIAALSKNPQKVLWSNIGNYTVPAGSNVKLVSWLPQNNLLGHSKTKLFISHCGSGGMNEAVYHGVPVLAMPLFGDQLLNAMKLVTAGMAVEFDARSDFNIEGKFETVLNELLVNPSYTTNARQLSRLVKDRLRTPAEESADWVEYVLRANGTKFLQPEAVNMTGIQHDLIDVKVFLVACLGLIVLAVAKLCKCLCRCCCGQKQKEKKL